jgi:hypothetical protein
MIRTRHALGGSQVWEHDRQQHRIQEAEFDAASVSFLAFVPVLLMGIGIKGLSLLTCNDKDIYHDYHR